MAQFRKCTGDIIETDVDDETVVVQLESGDMFSMAGTARAVWKLLDSEGDKARCIAALSEQYGAEAADVGPDVEAFLTEMCEAKLVTATS